MEWMEPLVKNIKKKTIKKTAHEDLNILKTTYTRQNNQKQTNSPIQIIHNKQRITLNFGKISIKIAMRGKRGQQR